MKATTCPSSFLSGPKRERRLAEDQSRSVVLGMRAQSLAHALRIPSEVRMTFFDIAMEVLNEHEWLARVEALEA